MRFLLGKEIAVGVTINPERVNQRFYQLVKPLLILSLYNHRFFSVPAIVVADPSWRSRYIERTFCPNYGIYEVKAEQWENFEKFVRLAESGLDKLKFYGQEPLLARKFSLASERYLLAAFTLGHQFLPGLEADVDQIDDTLVELDALEYFPDNRALDEESVIEETLLQYVFGLEALLLKKSEDKKNGFDKKKGVLGDRVGFLIAEDRLEEKFLRNFLQDVYEARNTVAHGERLDTPPDLVILRRIYQRALGVVLMIAAENSVLEAEKALNDLFYDTREIRQAANDRVTKARQQLFALISDSSRLDARADADSA